MDILQTLADELKIKYKQVADTVALIDGGNTIPFIARYRKEVTGALDDTVLRSLSERLEYLRSLEARRAEVKSAIEAQGKLTSEISASIERAKILTELEDIYRPFKPKRRTRASVAREAGLEELALMLLMQEKNYSPSIETTAEKYINAEAGFADVPAALAGACDIIAEDISDSAEYRGELRALTYEYGTLTSKKASEKTGETVYEMYYDYSEPLKTMPGHRVLAVNRAENEGAVKVSIDVPEDIALNYLFSRVVETGDSPAKKYVARACIDSYERLIAPSIEREIRADMLDNACEDAIKLFAVNLKNLLMAAPLRDKTVLGFDPGYRTGCKLAVVDRTGRVLDTAVIYPTKPQERIEESKKTLKTLIRRHNINIIAIGNGTASKESEIFIASLLREIPEDVRYAMVSEAGASVYSASEAGAEEFPDFDVTQRSAVSIARRLLDPLAELVKIDPKSIGVGQYQHDMKPARLDEALGGVVEDCVNSVGVDLNTASYSLLSYVAGINKTSAKNIVKYRDENGVFTRRSDVKKVPRVGERAYEQCAGFLRIRDCAEVLDNTGVHPESYNAARALLKKFRYSEDDVRLGRIAQLRADAEKYGISELCSELDIGEPTLYDIIGELEKPGRDSRDSMPPPVLRDDVMDMADLAPGMIMTGTVRNVCDFGAFVDIGVHEDGLVHVSQISNTRVNHPSDVLAAGDIVRVKVISVDCNKKRIGLTMKL